VRDGSDEHPRSDEVRGRETGYEAGFGDGGLGDRGGFGDQGRGETAHRDNPDDDAGGDPEDGDPGQA
jgi:hypothetical protein